VTKNTKAKREEVVLTGRGSHIISIPRKKWEDQLQHMPERHARLLDFMSPAHHQIRYFVVREMPRLARPIETRYIAERLELSHDAVLEILEDLESNLFFLVRNESGAVSWAYPVTVEETPHKLDFSTGEHVFAA
jgi:hypothetical protein